MKSTFRAATCAAAALTLVGCGSPGPAPTAAPTPHLPTTVGGVALTLETANPVYYASPDPTDVMVAILGDLGLDWGHLKFTGAAKSQARPSALPTLSIYATEVSGADPGAFLQAYAKEMAKSRPYIASHPFEQKVIGGRTVLVDRGDSAVLYAVVIGDTLYEISAPDDATAERALAGL